MLHEFTGGVADIANPRGSLLLSGDILYGMGNSGGASGLGGIFSIDTDGSNFRLLHSFSYEVDNGRSPFGKLIISGSTLYGVLMLE